MTIILGLLAVVGLVFGGFILSGGKMDVLSMPCPSKA